MNRLSGHNLPQHIRSFDYDRDAVTTGILHFGIGNFHRAHQAVYCEDLLNAGDTQWGITGVSLRSSAMRNALAPQDYLYTLAILGEESEYRIIGAIKNVLVAPEEPRAVIDLIAKRTTHLISSTITEKGYGLTSGKVDLQRADFQAELKSLAIPRTIYGFLARGIIQRCQTTNPPANLTIMCCDNITGGGEFLREGVEHLLQKHSLETLDWMRRHVSFVSSMVDRVCPAIDEALKEIVLKDTGRSDAWPVSAEPFSQWIIEGDFAGKRPDFEKVGAVFVDDISPFETMKLRYLNAAHTIVSTLGYLSGDIFVHQALERAEVFTFMREALYKNVLPNAAVPEGYDGASYIEDVIKRFQNSSLPYANLQVGTDSSQKIQQRWFPTIDQALGQSADVSYFEFCLGAWAIFIQTALENDVLNDPKMTEFGQVDTQNSDEMIMSYLTIAGAEKFQFYSQDDFLKAVKLQARNIKENGIKAALIDMLNLQEKSST